LRRVFLAWCTALAELIMLMEDISMGFDGCRCQLSGSADDPASSSGMAVGLRQARKRKQNTEV